MKRSPLKRNTPLRRKKMRESTRAKERRLSHEERMAELRPVVFARDSWRCQVRSSVCTNNGLQAHHLKPRSRGGPDTLDNLLTVCPHCHVFLHANPKWAAERGLLKAGWMA